MPCAYELKMSADAKTFSIASRWHAGGGWRNNISDKPTDDFTVRFSECPAQAAFDDVKDNASVRRTSGDLFIGFILPQVFNPTGHTIHRIGAYMLWPCRGVMYGTRADGIKYCPPFFSGTIRCTIDRVACTISFVVNGVDYGIAWRDVDGQPLHAFVGLWEPGFCVELV